MKKEQTYCKKSVRGSQHLSTYCHTNTRLYHGDVNMHLHLSMSMGVAGTPNAMKRHVLVPAHQCEWLELIDSNGWIQSMWGRMWLSLKKDTGSEKANQGVLCIERWCCSNIITCQPSLWQSVLLGVDCAISEHKEWEMKCLRLVSITRAMEHKVGHAESVPNRVHKNKNTSNAVTSIKSMAKWVQKRQNRVCSVMSNDVTAM